MAYSNSMRSDSQLFALTLLTISLSGCVAPPWMPRQIGANAVAIGCARNEIVTSDKVDHVSMAEFLITARIHQTWTESCQGRTFLCTLDRPTRVLVPVDTVKTCTESGTAVANAETGPMVATAILAGALGPTASLASAVEASPDAEALILPEPIFGNAGLFMSPFTDDDTVAPWVEKGMTASIGSNVCGAIGSYAGQKALEQVPFIGGFLGKKAGEMAGRQVAITAAGGMDFIKSSSDLSFNNLNDMARYVKGRYSQHPQYQKVIEATYGIYPEFKEAVMKAGER